MTATNSLLSRLFYMAVELRPILPPSAVLNVLGEASVKLIRAGAEHGLAGSVSHMAGVTLDQVANVYAIGADSGATPDLQEFKSALAGAIYEKLCGHADYSNLDKIRLTGKLDTWVNGSASMVADAEYSMDAEIAIPPFTRSGFTPFDQIQGEGFPQDIVLWFGHPGTMKTTFGVTLAKRWKESGIGSVTLIQTELSPALMRMKIDSQVPRGTLFNPETDKMVFGRGGADAKLEWLLENPDPDRLVIFDSLSGYCGGGDGPESRQRFYDVYDKLSQIKNVSRTVVAISHIKRGEGDNVSIESAAGSSAQEKFSGNMIFIKVDDAPRPDGLVEARLATVKNRYAQKQRPVKFLYDFRTGDTFEDYDVLGTDAEDFE